MEANHFIILQWFLPYTDMNQPWVYMCSLSWTPLLTPCPSHPSGSSQCTSPEHPVSCINPGLAIYFTYDNTHVSMLFSQIIPLSPSPTESKSLFFTSVSLFWILKAKMKYCTVLKMLEDLTTVYFLGYERLGGSIAQEKASTVGRTWAEGLIYVSLSSAFVMLGHLRTFT